MTIAVQKQNLATLRREGVRILTGSDAVEANVIDELIYLDAQTSLPRSEILDVATRVTPRAIFPGRPIGVLAGGFEASFIVIDGDPLADFESVRNVVATVKRGRVIAGSLGEETKGRS